MKAFHGRDGRRPRAVRRLPVFIVCCATLVFGSFTLTSGAAKANPEIQWTHQFGTAAADVAFGVAVDGAGNAYAAGYMDPPTVPDQTTRGRDAFLRKVDFRGNEAWTRQIDISRDDWAMGVAMDASGAVS